MHRFPYSILFRVVNEDTVRVLEAAKTRRPVKVLAFCLMPNHFHLVLEPVPLFPLDANTRVHMIADIDHSKLFEPVFERYVTDERTARLVVNAAQDSLAIDRAYLNALAVGMMEIPE